MDSNEERGPGVIANVLAGRASFPENTTQDILSAQYHAAKERHPGMVLMFRVGDFYEMYEDDANTVAKVLGLAMASRDGMPMCGILHQTLGPQLHKLLKAGYRVAVCEPVEEAPKGVVPEKVAVETPGEMDLLEAKPKGKKPTKKAIRKELVDKLADLFRRAKEAAIAADVSEEDGGTCNFDTPAFRIEKCQEKVIQEAAELAGVSVDDFKWFGRKRWFWLRGFLNGQGNRRSRMMEAATKVLKTGEETIPGFHACGYYQMD